MIDLNEKIKILAIKNKISVRQLAIKSSQSPENLNNKMSRNNFKITELERLADALGCSVEVNFIMPDGTKI